MTAVIFDTLVYAKKLKAVGFTEAQAEMQAEGIAELIDNKLATKQDLILLDESLKRNIHGTEERLMYKLTTRLGSIIVAGISILAVLIKLH